MATLREIRRRISGIKSTQQITKAMKMVAAAKLRKAQENILALRPYAYSLRDLIAHLSEDKEIVERVSFFEKRPVESVLLVLVTADRGLCGAFNSNLIKATMQRVNEYKGKNVEIYAIGKKGFEFLKKRDYSLKDNKIGFFNHLHFEDALEISRNLVTAFSNKSFDRIEIIYNEFKSAIRQDLTIEQFLPFVPEDAEQDEQAHYTDYLFEPDKESILNSLIPKNLNMQIWRILLESNAAEQGARMTAMENATENAEEIKSKLTLYYNRARQAAITKELAEIVGGAEALKES